MRVFYVFLLLSAISTAQNPVRTITRSVLQFGDLERKLALASPADKGNYLADDFEERLCAEPGTPVARDQWLAQPGPKFSFRQESVHDFGETSIFSALAVDGDSRVSLVDVWRKEGNSYKLAVRYFCPATGPTPAPASPKRY